MAVPKIKKVESVEVLHPDDDHSNNEHDKNRTTTVHRRIRTLAVEVEELIEIRSEAEKSNAR